MRCQIKEGQMHEYRKNRLKQIYRAGLRHRSVSDDSDFLRRITHRSPMILSGVPSVTHSPVRNSVTSTSSFTKATVTATKGSFTEIPEGPLFCLHLGAFFSCHAAMVARIPGEDYGHGSAASGDRLVTEK